jgi:hypothetical protein
MDTGTVQIAPGGGTQGMAPMHPPAPLDIRGMACLVHRPGDRR